MWTLVSPLIDETSRSKFLFYGGNDYQDPGGLIDYISNESIPDWIGGSASCDIPEGGLVPKSFYMSVEAFEKDQSPGPHFLEESFYHSMSLSKGQVQEGIITISDRGSVITWDFDVMRNDVVFTVYRLRNPLPQPVVRAEREKSPNPTPTVVKETTTFTFPTATEGATPIPSGEHQNASCIDKGWREGSDFFKVENSIVCHDGESIQGSHVTSHVGTYLLQWKFFDKPTMHQSPLDDVIDSFTTMHSQHKAKVMYYYETLNSVDYRGSMTSLQSCQSGFSTISKVSAGKHSTSGVSSGVGSSISERLANSSHAAAAAASANS
jgi:hypothetical protein